MNAPYRSAVRRFGVVGHPIGHSLSPVMMRAAFDALGLACSYEAVDAPDEQAMERLVTELRAGAWDGLNVTVPHKRRALALADAAGQEAERSGAANVLVREANGRVRAENTDAPAIVRVLEPLLRSRRWALVVGSGGAARAALLACEALGFRGVDVTSRSWTSPEVAWHRGSKLPEIKTKMQFEPWITEWGVPSQLVGREVDLVIQATSAGMLGADPGEDVVEHVPWGSLPRTAVAFDLVYRPRSTPFLVTARREGLVTEGGLGMLVEQAALAVQMWLGVAPPIDVMRQAAEKELRESRT
ncbi:MAG: shikimate dehydrogenase [Polyangiaceae bacterium]